MFLTNLKVGRGHSISFFLEFRFLHVLSKVFRLALFVLGGELLRNILNCYTFSVFLSVVAVTWRFGDIYRQLSDMVLIIFDMALAFLFLTSFIPSNFSIRLQPWVLYH